jgi:hypothetical protein
MAVGQRQRLYSGVGVLTGKHRSSTPRALRVRGVELELNSLACDSSRRRATALHRTRGDQ